MQRRQFIQSAAALPALVAVAGAGELPETIALPKPQTQGGKPLMQALAGRKTTREIGEKRLSPQMLSNLLWAAFGVNRPGGNRTAPSAMNVKEMDIYAFLPEGIYLFDANVHSLKPILAGDHRAESGTQPDVGKAGVSLLYVADFDKYGTRVADPAMRTACSNAHAGFIAQNVYLFAASEGLASWFRAFVDSAALAKLLNLRPSQKVLYSHGVGFPVG